MSSRYYYFSDIHIRSAILFANHAFEVESKKEQPEHIHFIGRFEDDPHTSYIFSSIILSVAFLEAVINETFETIAYEIEGCYSESIATKIKRGKRIVICNEWRENRKCTKSRKTIEKYNYFLELADLPTLAKGESPCQDVQVLINLRNYLIHYAPSKILNGGTQSSESETNKIIIKMFNKLKENTFTPKSADWFPEKVISYKTARWSIKSVFDFTLKFAEQIGWISFGQIYKEMMNKMLPILKN